MHLLSEAAIGIPGHDVTDFLVKYFSVLCGIPLPSLVQKVENEFETDSIQVM